MALSKNKIKYIRSLKDKKHRSEHGTFVAEGNKLVFDLLAAGCKCQFLAGLPDVLPKNHPFSVDEILETDETELKKASFLKTAPQIIGVFYQPEVALDEKDINGKLNLVLDGIQDPGNLGTIVRLADWFGIEHIFCSYDTADIYNPKTVQATMGAIARVNVHYTDIAGFLKKNTSLPVYGTFLDGETIYSEELSSDGFIVMGSEGKGVSARVAAHITKKLYIPYFPKERKTSESLNVASATAIILSEFRRRQ